MFRKDHLFKAGWLFFILMFPLASLLPEWTGEENGLIENLQMLWLFGGVLCCITAHKHTFTHWSEHPYALWKAGILFFFLLIMREISWGRTFFPKPDGTFISYSEMGLYGQLVHPTVALIILSFIILLYRAKVWRAFQIARFPVTSSLLLLLFIGFSWVGERTNFFLFHGEVAEELAEFGTYMMMFYLTKDAEKRLQDKTDNKKMKTELATDC